MESALITQAVRMHAPQVLAGCSAQDLNYVLVHINTAALVEVAGRHTMDALTQQRLPQLRIVTRCARSLLQRGPHARCAGSCVW
jgi:hypothetical protein